MDLGQEEEGLATPRAGSVGGYMNHAGDATIPIHPSAFAWRNIGCSVATRGKAEVLLLDAIWGCLGPSEMLAIIGPSGAGKSTFLDIVAGRKTVGRIKGDVLFQGQPTTPAMLRCIASYVTQEDIFHPTQTVLEAVMFQAVMQLDSAIPHNKKLAMAQDLIARAGLQGKESQWIGGILPGSIRLRGLSGGEKRRLSMCCSTVTHPAVLFADEPTSGLDGLAALMTANLLRDFCNDGMIALCTIHQPREAIWSLFDKVLILGKGYQLFYGTPSDAEVWFTSLGLSHPLHTSPADFIMDHANIDYDKAKLFGQTFQDTHDLHKAANQFRTQHPWMFKAEDEVVTVTSYERPAEGEAGRSTMKRQPRHANWGIKYLHLLGRSFRSQVRNPANGVARLVITVAVAVVEGLVYKDVGVSHGPATLRNLFGATFFPLLTVALLPYASMSSFLYDRHFFQSEDAAGIYPCSAFYLANVTMEMVFNGMNGVLFGAITYYLMNFQAFVQAPNPSLSALGYVASLAWTDILANVQVMFLTLASPNQEVAFIVNAAYTTICALTAGIYVSLPDVFPPVRFIATLSMLRYSYQAILLNFFKDNPHTIDAFGLPVERYLQLGQLNEPGTVAGNLCVSAIIYMIFVIGGYFCLKCLYKEKR